MVMLNARDLSHDYFNWLKSNQSFSQIDSNVVRIDLPFEDGFEDAVTIYAIR